MRRLGWLVAMLCATPWAARAQSHVVVLDFSGPQAAQLRSDVVELVEEHQTGLLELERVKQTATELSVELDDESGRAAVAREEAIAAFIEGKIEKNGKRLELTVHVYSGHDGSEVGAARVSARPALLDKRLRTRLGPELQSLLAETRAPERTEPEPEPLPEEIAEEDQVREPPPATGSVADDMRSVEEVMRPEGLVLGVYASLLSRSLSYKDAVLALSTHQILFNLAPAVSARLYPMAFVSDGVLAHVGLDFRASYLLFATSVRDGQSYKTRSLDLLFGLHGRLPLGGHQLGLGVAYGMQSTSFDKASDGSSAGVPNVHFVHLRIAADGRLAVAGVFLQPAVALLMPWSLGQISSNAWFPHAKGIGVDASLHLAIPMGHGFEIVIGGAYRQWGLSLNPKPSDRSVTELRRAAGGATDRYVNVDLGLMLRY